MKAASLGLYLLAGGATLPKLSAAEVAEVKEALPPKADWAQRVTPAQLGVAGNVVASLYAGCVVTAGIATLICSLRQKASLHGPK